MARPEREQQQGHDLDPNRVLQKIQQDPQGALLVQNAMLMCMVEDQQTIINDLQSKLVENSQAAGEATET